MSFDVRRYLESLGIEYVGEGNKNAPKNSVAIHCIFCQDDDPSQHLAINYIDGWFYCWICGKSGDLVTLIKNLEGVSWQEAKESVATSLRVVSGEDESDLVKKIFDTRASIFDGDSVSYELTPLPDEAMPIETGTESRLLKKFIVRRKLSLDVIQRYRLHYCTQGKYEHRVILPIYNEVGDLLSFGARSMLEVTDYPYLYPRNFNSKEWFFGADYLGQTDTFIVVEGIFDAMRIGAGGLATFSNKMSDVQRWRLTDWYYQGAYKELIIAFDSDAFKRGWGVATKLRMHVKKVKCLELPPKQDPDSLGLPRLRDLISKTNYL